MLTCCVCAGAWAQGTAGSLNVPTVMRNVGGTPTAKNHVLVVKGGERQGVIKIQLTGSTNYRDMQFDLTLPDGISLVTEPTTENPVVKVDAKEGQNHVLFYALNGQTVKIAVVDNVVNHTGDAAPSADTYGKYLVDGIVFELPIKAAATFEGVKDATISNLAFTDDAATADIAVTGTTTFGIDDILLGDVNDDGEVKNSDQVAIVMHLLDEPSTPFVFEAADMVYDAENPNFISNADAISLADKLLEESSSAKVFIEEVVSDVETEIEPD